MKVLRLTAYLGFLLLTREEFLYLCEKAVRGKSNSEVKAQVAASG